MSLEITSEDKILSAIDLLSAVKQDIFDIRKERDQQKLQIEEQSWTIQNINNKLKLKDERIKELEEFKNKYLVTKEMLISAQVKNITAEEDLANIKVKLKVTEDMLATALEHIKIDENILEENSDTDKAQVASEHNGIQNSEADNALVASENDDEQNLEAENALEAFEYDEKHIQNNCAVANLLKRKGVPNNNIETLKKKRLDVVEDIEIHKIRQPLNAECSSPAKPGPTPSDCTLLSEPGPTPSDCTLPSAPGPTPSDCTLPSTPGSTSSDCASISLISNFDVIKNKILSFTQPLPSFEEFRSLTRVELCGLARELVVNIQYNTFDKDCLVLVIVIDVYNKETEKTIPKELYSLYNYPEAIRKLIHDVNKIHQVKALDANAARNNATAQGLVQMKENAGSGLKLKSLEKLVNLDSYKIRDCKVLIKKSRMQVGKYK